jgi:hypothetical protein
MPNVMAMKALSLPRRRLTIESLESRLALSASPLVTATLSGGQLQLTGNAADCEVEVSQTDPKQFLVTGIGGTQINFGGSQSDSQAINGVSGGINVNLPGAGGTNAFGLTDADVHGNVNIVLGRGRNLVGLGVSNLGNLATNTLTVRGNLNINTGAGGSFISESAVRVLQDENINMGAGVRQVEIDFDDEGIVTVHNDFNINANGAGNTLIEISGIEFQPAVRPAAAPFEPIISTELIVGNNFNINVNTGTLNAVLNDLVVGTNLNINCTHASADIEILTAAVRQNTNINTGSGQDSVSLEYLSARSLNVSLGAASDNLSLTGVTTTIGTNFDGGSGNDTLDYLYGNSLAKLHFFHFEIIGEAPIIPF